jgi:hypothetical protein
MAVKARLARELAPAQTIENAISVKPVIHPLRATPAAQPTNPSLPVYESVIVGPEP